MKELRMTVLCENTVGRLVGTGEHGFSVLIESDRGDYLFDTGNGHGIVANSLALRKDLRTVKRIFLSHGHQDHSGGLPEVLKLRGEVDVHGHPSLFSDRISVTKEKNSEIRRYVGLPYKRMYLELLGARFVLNTGFTQVEDGVFLTGEVPRKTDFEKSDPRLFAVLDGKTLPDSFPDDQSLLLDTGKGLVLILGCAHAGMINILRYAMEQTGKERFCAILGGTHLNFLTPEQLETSIQALKGISFERIGVSHCTGLRAVSRLQQEFGERFFQGCVGAVLEV